MSIYKDTVINSLFDNALALIKEKINSEAEHEEENADAASDQVKEDSEENIEVKFEHYDSALKIIWKYFFECSSRLGTGNKSTDVFWAVLNYEYDSNKEFIELLNRNLAEKHGRFSSKMVSNSLNKVKYTISDCIWEKIATKSFTPENIANHKYAFLKTHFDVSGASERLKALSFEAAENNMHDQAAHFIKIAMAIDPSIGNDFYQLSIGETIIAISREAGHALGRIIGKLTGPGNLLLSAHSQPGYAFKGKRPVEYAMLQLETGEYEVSLDRKSNTVMTETDDSIDIKLIEGDSTEIEGEEINGLLIFNIDKK